MSLNAKVSTSSFKIAPDGKHLARCYGVADLGTHLFNGNASQKIMFFFELPNELVKDKQGNMSPMTIFEEVSNYINVSKLSKLHKILNGWAGRNLSIEDAKNVDLTALAGKACWLNIIHEQKTQGAHMGENKAVIASIKQCAPTDPKQPAVNEPFIFTFENMEEFKKVPEWLQKKIKQSPEWQQAIKGDSQEIPDALGQPEPWDK